jgi:hypothetical protein
VIAKTVAGYLAIGVVLALSPLGRAEIAKQVRSARGDPLANAITGREAPPEWTVAMFRLLITLGLVLLWPIALVSLWQEKRARDAWVRGYEARLAQGLEYSRMGGAGEIHCHDCGFRQEITSFTHGFTMGPAASADEGRQCLQCGRFTTVHRKGNPPVTPVPPCECGGELSRDHFLFCPKCRSRKLKYDMSFIT